MDEIDYAIKNIFKWIRDHIEKKYLAYILCLYLYLVLD